MPTTIQLKRATTDIVDKATLKPGELAVATDTGKVHLDSNQLIVPDELAGVISFDDTSIESVDVIPGEVGPFNLANTDVTLSDGSSFSEAILNRKQTGPQGPQGLFGPQGTEGSQGPKGNMGEQGVDGSEGPKGSSGEPGMTGPSGQAPYDVVIKTQEDFDALLASPDWLGAHSVLFVGDGKDSPMVKFAYSGKVIVPSTVTEIVGTNAAILMLTQLKYQTKPALSSASTIRNIEIHSVYSTDSIFSDFINVENCGVVRSIAKNAIGFDNCENVTSCYMVISDGDPMGNDAMIGFKDCKNVTNCDVVVNYSSGKTTIGFQNCINLYDCSVYADISIGVSNYGKDVIGYKSCQNLANCSADCSGRGQSDLTEYPSKITEVYAYHDCSGLINCQGFANSELNDYASTGIMYCYVFFECNKLTNCSGYSFINFPGEIVGDSSQGYQGETGVFSSCQYINGCRLAVSKYDWLPSGSTIGPLLHYDNIHVDSMTVSEG